MRVSLNHLATVDEQERNRLLGALVTAAKGPPGERMAEIVREIEGYEARHGMTSAELQRRLGTGETQESDEISKWLFLLSTRRLVLGY